MGECGSRAVRLRVRSSSRIRGWVIGGAARGYSAKVRFNLLQAGGWNNTRDKTKETKASAQVHTERNGRGKERASTRRSS